MLNNFTKLLLGIKYTHVWVSQTECRCGYKPKTPKDWDTHIAEEQAKAVITYIEER